ncbi:hypothetical protein NXW50_30915 [Bacteroides thetaiotaomicron]|nr:hypothetical protein [Bacteroides thetaiotaomicron]MCS2282379.1 hypothetical protein [Bacteroides thetaiotaomicron]
MHNGEIHFIYNEVEIADIFRFWGLLLCENRGVYECRKLSDDDGAVFRHRSTFTKGIIWRLGEKVWKISVHYAKAVYFSFGKN